MSKNICPCCGGYSEYLDIIEAERTQFLCKGCEIKLYFPLHEIMNKLNVSKEEAYKLIKNSEGDNKMKKVTIKLLDGVISNVFRIYSQDDPNREVKNLSLNEIYKCIANSKFIVVSTLEGSVYLINTSYIVCIN